MAKVTFLGAGSTVFAKNVLGDTMLSPALHDAHLALYDIDATRLEESRRMLETINRNVNQGRAKITAHLGVARRRDAPFLSADFRLQGLGPAAEYELEDADTGRKWKQTGKALGERGVRVEMEKAPESRLVFYNNVRQ
jgi:alpha-galactosidase